MIMDSRKALIMAATYGWNGDGQSEWPCPATLETIISWAKSHMDSDADTDELADEFKKLESQGLFFRVHPDAFVEPAYYCSYDDVFLAEIYPDSEHDPFGLWVEWKEENDEEFGQDWRKHGICLGRGSQGGNSTNGSCQGKECLWYKDKSPECNWGLRLKY